MNEKNKMLDKRAVANARSKSEKLSWSRKQKAIESLIESLKPIEEKIHELMLEKLPILDKINKKRVNMKKYCVHPIKWLVHSVDMPEGNYYNDTIGKLIETDYILCKFCNTKIKLNKENKENKENEKS